MSKAYISTAMRQLVYERAGGQCEYCLMPDEYVLVTHEIDHIIAQKHGGKTEADNLALSCTLCNKHKGSDLASFDVETGQIVPLFNPRNDQWVDHFSFADGMILPETATGRVTVNLLQLNRPEQVLERRMLFDAGLLRIPS